MSTFTSGVREYPRRSLAALTALLVAFSWLVVGAPIALADGPTTFSNAAKIDIPASGSTNQTGPASPYPSTIAVSGMSELVTNVTVTFNNLTHGAVNDIDALVVAPSAENIVVLSDVGDPNPSDPGAQLVTADNINLTFSDSAAGPVPRQFILPSGTFKPTNTGGGDTFPGSAPTPSAQTTLAGAFTGISPNGDWKLYVVDDNTGEVGAMAGGWSLTITTETAAVATTTTVATSDSSSTTGDPVTFTATVAAGGSPVTSGTVQFSDGTSNLGTPVPLDGSGKASLTTSSLTEGTHQILATYSGATGFLASNETVTQRVDNLTVVTGNTFCNTGVLTLPSVGAAQPYPSNINVSGVSGNITKVTASLKGISHQAPGDLDVLLSHPTPAKNLFLLSDAGGFTTPVSNLDVTFDDDAATGVTDPLVSGAFRPTNTDDGSNDAMPAPAPTPSSATALSTFNGADANGQWSLWVVDDASGDSGSIAGGWCLTVTAQAATTTTLTTAPSPSTFGADVTLTATVTSGGSAVTAGSVQFSDGATLIGSPVAVGADGKATLSTSSLTVGTHSLTATYSGTTSFGPSTGTASQVVGKVTTTTTLTAAPNPSTTGAAVTLTATVGAGGSPVTTGTVQFSDGATNIGSPVAVGAGGVATLTTSSLDVGSHGLKAEYSGTATLGASSATATLVVGKTVTVTALTGSPNPSAFGDDVTLTATVTAGGSPVTAGGSPVTASSVQFSEDDTAIGAPVAVGADGTATLTTSDLTVGSHSIQAAYTGTDAFADSTDTVDQVVGKAPTTIVLVSGQNPSNSGQPVTFTATVSSASGPISEGSVSFSVDGTVVEATVDVDAGQAAWTASSLNAGVRIITAQYSGSDSYQTNPSNSVSQTVNLVADVGGPYTVAEGDAVTLDGSGSSPALTYTWDVNGDGVFGDASGISPTLTWAELEALGVDDGPATHDVAVKVIDGTITLDSATATLTVTNTPPTVVVTGDLNTTAGEPFTVDLGAEDPSSADMAAQFTYTIEWGDGSAVETVTGPAVQSATHTYSDPGTFSASVIAADKDGGQGGEATIDVSVEAGPTPTPTPTPSASPTPSPKVTPTATPTVKPTSGRTDLYSTPGYHSVNGRRWFTTCEPYSQTVRCRTSIWATQVTHSNGTFQRRTAWYFNNMTYLPYMKRSQWANNPLGHAGEWTASDGRKWRTECDTPVTGGNGCRSWIWASYITSELDSRGNRAYHWTNGWVFNNIVRFR